MSLILASSSPRRQELLQQITTDFVSIPAQVSEHITEPLTPAQHVQTLAARKGNAVFAQQPTATVLSADTVVSFREQIFGKPKSLAAARTTLNLLQDQTHQVYTAVWLKRPQQPVLQQVVRTDVTFLPLTPHQIERYLSTGEYRDKAGAYGIQGYGGLLIKAIAGDYYNVMGLPLSVVSQFLAGDELFLN
ncbi:Maf family protein [Loigolactobacillus binensis]|uniref:dTTP/UTP pyrophosphatase n=1 Tax=Loigolactobacillus binensis TaxID=2559922 RepID=A0ABW3EBG9_9LACO|nr:Maf family protein [Loigolactobacillus binensis]